MNDNSAGKPAFEQKGLKGYRYALLNKDVELYRVDVLQGHDTYIISKQCTHLYYVLEGNGAFEMNGQTHAVYPGTVLEMPPGVEYTYYGQMKLLLIRTPPWFAGNEEVTRPNPRVS